MTEAIWFMMAAAFIIIDIRDAIRKLDRANSYIAQSRYKEAAIEMAWAAFLLVIAGLVYWSSWYEVIGVACG